ncbi:MAG: putative porin [Bdellovibrio sp.]
MKICFLLPFLFAQAVAAQTTPLQTSPEGAVVNTPAVNSTATDSTAPEAKTVITVPPEILTNKKEAKEEPFLVFGDFRYRHQNEKQGPKDQRTIQRIQARLGVTSQLHDNLKVTFRLMTGSSANSGNQTLGDEKAPGMPRRSFGLDQAFFDYSPSSSWNLYGGKMPQIFTFVGKNQMILDNDITPEGLGLKFVQPTDGNLEFFFQGGMFWIRENYDNDIGKDLTDNFLNAGQIGVQWKPLDWTVTFGLGSFAYTDLKDTPPANISSGGSGNGNTLDINGYYPTNFDIDEIFVEGKTKLGSVELSLFFESLSNKDADNLNKAHAIGAQAKTGPWNFGFMQKEVQKDSVVGVFTDSDFGGGVTSVRGTVWNLGYKISKKVQVQYTLFNNETAIDLVAMKYDRSHLDLMMVFKKKLYFLILSCRQTDMKDVCCNYDNVFLENLTFKPPSFKFSSVI